MKKFLIIILLVLFLPNFCSATQSAVKVYKSALDQAIAYNTWTKVVFDAESWDILNEFSSSRFTATTSGYYLVTGYATFANLGDGKIFVIGIYQNGTKVYSASSITGASGLNPTIAGSSVVYLAVGDYVEIWVYHGDIAGSKDIWKTEGLTGATFTKINETGGAGSVTWGGIAGTLSNQTDLQTALNNLNMDKYFQLISNTSTGAEFYLEKTMDYGQALIIFFFTLFTICLICLVIWRFFWKK
jgi:hypothetical protein